jgi:hypothetical protein
MVAQLPERVQRGFSLPTERQAPPCRPTRDLAGWGAWAAIVVTLLGVAFGAWGRFNKLEARQSDAQKNEDAALQDVRDRLNRIELILLEDENEQRANQDRSQREKERRASLKNE